jgi:hypothetical protein
MRVQFALSGLCAALLVACGSPPANDFFAAASGPAAGGSPAGASGGSQAVGGSTSIVSGGSNGTAGTAPSGTGGSAGTAGSSSSGGTGGIGDISGFQSNEEPIDDMEDGDDQLLEQGGRDGYWFVISDGTGWTSPPTGQPFAMGWNQQPRGMSTRSAQLQGGNFTSWGAELVFTYTSGDGPPAYSVSNYSGITFFGRSVQGQIEVNVRFPDVSTHPNGGICGASPPCYNDFHAHVMLTDQWQKYHIPFSILTQDEATGAMFNTSTTYMVQFNIAGGTNFDVWIDDVAFVTN